MTTALALSASFIIMFSFFLYIFKACFCFCESLCIFVFFFSFRLIFHNFSKNLFSSLLLFLSGKNLVLFLRGIYLYLLFLNISISLNFLSNSLRSFLSSPMLLHKVGTNLRPSLRRFIWSLFNLCVDNFLFNATFVFYIVFYSPLFCLKSSFCLYFFKNRIFLCIFYKKIFCVVVFRVAFIVYYWVCLVSSGVICVVVESFLLLIGVICVVVPPILLWVGVVRVLFGQFCCL